MPYSKFRTLILIILWAPVLAYMSAHGDPCTSMGDAGGDDLCLIDEEGNFTNPIQIHQAFARWNISNVVSNYVVISIEGPQSSGKSLLLNRLFDTQFQVMHPLMLQQTTKGIWMTSVKGTNMIVLDVEGSDSRERQTQGDVASERKRLSFTLAHANILLINIWKAQIPLYKSAGFPLLQTIFERNIRLFQNRNIPKGADLARKVLLFVIRDNDNQTPFDQLVQALQTNLEHIWSAIDNDGLSLHDYFVLEFVSFPHYIHSREAFDATVLGLRNRFNDQPGGLLFPNSRTNIPISAFPEFMQKNYAAIQGDEVLNLPSQRHIVLEYRMDSIAREILGWVRDEGTKELRDTLENGQPVDGFGAASRRILETSLDRFTSSTAGFNVSSSERHLGDLRRAVPEFLKPLYIQNIYNLQVAYETAYTTELNTCTDLWQFFAKAKPSKEEKLRAFEVAQGEALDPDWIEHRLGKDLNLHLDQSDNVGHKMSMETRARLYVNGHLACGVYTRCRNSVEELRGRVRVSVKDRAGDIIASTETFHCGTRCAVLDLSCGSSGHNDFTHQFSLDILTRMARLEIFQWDT